MDQTPSQNKQIGLRRNGREVSAPHADGDLIVVRPAGANEVPLLHQMTVAEIGPSVASLETMLEVHKHNQDSLWSIYRRPITGEPERLAGYFGFLHLNKAGLVALEQRTLNGRCPQLSLLAASGERPAAIYVWAGIARKMRKIAEMLIAEGLGADRYGGLPIYATAGTLGGLKWLNHLGEADRGPGENGLGNVFRIDTAKSVAARASPPAA